MIQLRNVPDDLHVKLKVRAAKAGMSLSDYIQKELGRWANVPTNEELMAEILAAPSADLSRETILRAIHEGRAGR